MGVQFSPSSGQVKKERKKNIIKNKKKAMHSSLKTFFPLLMLVALTSAASLRPQTKHYGIPSSLLQMDEDYDDFSEVPKVLRYAYNLPVRDEKLVDFLLPPKKRHLGIDIPDYISSIGKSEALKEMSDKMKHLGRK